MGFSTADPRPHGAVPAVPAAARLLGPALRNVPLAWWLALGFGAILVAGGATLYLHLVDRYAGIIERYEIQSVKFAHAATRHAEQVFLHVDLGLRNLDADPVTERLDLKAPSLDLHTQLRRLLQSSPIFEGIGVVGPDGRVSASADSPQPFPTDLSDRDYFQIHRASSEAGLLISAPVIGRPSGRRVIPVSRRVDDASGGFAGVAAARIKPEYFEEFLRSLGSDVATVIHTDGTVLARYPEGERYTGQQIGVDSVLRKRIGVEREGFFHTVSSLDGIARIVGYSVSDRVPVVVAVAYDLDGILAEWSAERDRAIFFAVVLIALLTAFGVFAVSRAQREAELAVETAAAHAAAELAQFVAEAADRAKSEFLAHMSHELRTPLNAVIGFGQLLAGEAYGPHSSPKYGEYSRDIVFGGEHLLRIINNILDLAKVSAGKWTLDEEPVRIGDVADEVIQLIQVRAQLAEVAVSNDVSPELPLLLGDHRVILQILLNLVSNSVKYTPRDGMVRLTAELAADRGIVVRVADTGIGLSEADIAKVLTPFGRPAEQARHIAHDTGLGLTLCEKFTQLHGGTLGIRSQVGHGTTVSITFPARRTITTPPPPAILAS